MGEGRTREDVHARNLEAVRLAVSEYGMRTRGSIAAATGLAKSSVARLVIELIERGVLVEEPGASTGALGRPGRLLGPALSSRVGLGLELRRDGLTVAIADPAGRVLHRAGITAPMHVQQPTRVLEQLTAMAWEAIARAEDRGFSPAGATVAVAPDLGWPTEQLALEMRVRLSIAVTVENAVTLAAIAEIADPRGARVRDCFYVTANAGVSARIIAGGDVRLDSRSGHVLDAFGHISVDDGGHECGCGRRGCLDAYVQRAAVLRAAGLSDARLTDLVEHARASDPRTLVALRRCGRWLGVALASAVNLIAPPAIVIGGDLARLARWISPALEEELALRVLGYDHQWPELIVSRLEGDAPVLGAAAAALRAGPAA